MALQNEFVGVRPTLDDAIQLLRDPSLRSTAPPQEGMLQMRGSVIIERLMQGGLERVDAIVLVAQALQVIGGENRSRRRLGGRKHKWQDDFWVPQEELNDTGQGD